MAVLQYYIAKDAETEILLAQWDESNEAEKPKLVLKHSSEVRTTINEQLKHIRCNCLSDEEGFELYREVNGKCYCARGSSKNERNNLSIQDKAFAPSQGLRTSIRRTWVEFTRHNKGNNVRRCGQAEEDNFSSDLEWPC